MTARNAATSAARRAPQSGRPEAARRPVAAPPAAPQAKPAQRRRLSPIVPSSSVSGRTLMIVIAIMTYLASLTVGAVDLTRKTAAGWERDVVRETTVQIRPAEGRDLDAAAATVERLARATPGVAHVRAYSDAETARLLEPWLGSGLALDDLPIPRLVVLKLQENEEFDAESFRQALAREAPGATLDDHRRFLDRLVAMARAVVWFGLAVLVLMLAATVLSVVFATRGAMASNRDIVQVLHFVGARDGYIAAQFQRRFLRLGLKGGLVGGVLAILTFLIAGLTVSQGVGSAAVDQMDALFGAFEIGVSAYVGVVAIVLLIAGLTAVTSRATVYRTLRAMG
jgi:cell division transport system permease protein